MPDYQKAKIYQITSTTDPRVYVGSTIRDLHSRLDYHIGSYWGWRCYGQKKISWFDIMPANYTHATDYNQTIKIQLLEDYPCYSKTELNDRVQFWINHTNTVV